MNVADLQLATQHLGGVPVINAFSDRLGLPELLERFVPGRDARLRVTPSVVLGVVIRNLVVHREPLDALAEWAKPYDPAMLELSAADVELLDDDRVGRSLERLFHFLHIADCKLATRANMDHIHRAGGRFVSVLPANRKVDRAFRDSIVNCTPEWAFAASTPSRYRDAPDDVWHTTEAPWPSAEGYRIVWLHSSAKEGCDAKNRHDHIAQGIHALDPLNQRLASPRTRIRGSEAAEEAAHAALNATRSGRWLRFVTEARTAERYPKSSAAGPAPRPATGSSPAPAISSRGASTSSKSRTTPPPTAAGRSSPTTAP